MRRWPDRRLRGSIHVVNGAPHCLAQRPSQTSGQRFTATQQLVQLTQSYSRLRILPQRAREWRCALQMRHLLPPQLFAYRNAAREPPPHLFEISQTLQHLFDARPKVDQTSHFINADTSQPPHHLHTLLNSSQQPALLVVPLERVLQHLLVITAT